MKTKIKKVHYCDFCKKRSFFIPSMQNHEAHCTMNPKRKCKMCDIAGEIPLPPISEEVSKILWHVGKEEFPSTKQSKEAIDNLRKHFNGCPACLLAALRQNENNVSWESFKFKDECVNFFALQRELRPEDYYPSFRG